MQNTLEISPNFNETVQSAKYDETFGLWRVKTIRQAVRSAKLRSVSHSKLQEEVGKSYCGERVLVVGCGNSGMEVSLDLCNHNAKPSIVVRSPCVAQGSFRKINFEFAVSMMKWLPLRLVDKILFIFAYLTLGNTARYGLKRPYLGPLELKNTGGKTGTRHRRLRKIKSGKIKIVQGSKSSRGTKSSYSTAKLSRSTWSSSQPAIEARSFMAQVMEVKDICFHMFRNFRTPSLENELFSNDGIPKNPFPNGWKGTGGLYAVGFKRRGLSGASLDAISVAHYQCGKMKPGEEKSGPTASKASLPIRIFYVHKDLNSRPSLNDIK
ncbi:Myosin XI B isoform 1 [Hibiscus syriacus]|uniref:indole-3-pyruvate monooxygenase n=1 Tax=Hibiscus syriacus TaxID=106335 RepID=A0A6A2ZN92_HIBSY|nr:Myosin XI B isoform 1 [Hibiscus syriacus]